MSLQFSDTTNKAGLIQECETLLYGPNGYGTISGNTNMLLTFTRLINEALNSVASLIMQSDGRWQWDDNNDTDFPVATTNLVTTVGSEQQDYTFDLSFLKILRVEILDSAGNWRKLNPIDQADIFDQSLTDFLKTAGLPMYYDKIGNSLLLYPKPLGTAVTASGGLKVYFQRPPSYFVSTDTTKVPGINSLHHRIIAYKAALDYAMANSLSVAGGVMRGGFKTGLLASVDMLEDRLKEDYLLRNKDDHVRLKVRPRRYN